MNLPVVAYIAMSSVLLPSVVGLMVLRRLEKDFRLLYGLFCFHALLTIIQFVMAIHKVNNLWTSHIYYVVEVIVIFRVYSIWISSPKTNRVFSLLTITYIILWTITKFSIESFASPALLTPIVSRILLLGSSLYLLLSLASNVDVPLYQEPKFWFAAGFLVMCAGSIMFYGFRVLIFQFSLDAINTVLTVNWINTILSNSLHIIGFLCILRLPNTGGQLALAR